MRTARPLLNLKHSALLVMCSWLKWFYCEMNSKYNTTLVFFDCNYRRALLLRPHPSVILIASETESSRTCLIGYSDFISHEKFFVAGEAGTHTHAHTCTHMHPHRNDFKKPGVCWPALVLKVTLFI